MFMAKFRCYPNMDTGHGTVWVLSQHFPGQGLELFVAQFRCYPVLSWNNLETSNMSGDSHCPSWDSDQEPPDYKPRALALYQLFLLILVRLLLLLLSSSLVTGPFFLVLLLNQRWSPPLRLQASHCSTFRIMCHVPSIAVFCSESIECFPGTLLLLYNLYFCAFCFLK
jgi:hypothetical protein